MPSTLDRRSNRSTQSRGPEHFLGIVAKSQRGSHDTGLRRVRTGGSPLLRHRNGTSERGLRRLLGNDHWRQTV